MPVGFIDKNAGAETGSECLDGEMRAGDADGKLSEKAERVQTHSCVGTRSRSIALL